MARIIVVIMFAFGTIGLLHDQFTISKKNILVKHNNIVIIATPKSGSDYILENLLNGLRYRRGFLFGDESGNKLYHDFFHSENLIAKNHAHVANLDLQQYKKYSKSLVVHFRDPRQVILSWVHHVNKFKDNSVAQSVPNEFFAWDLSRQIDWVISNKLKRLCAWQRAWLEAIKLENGKLDGLRILVTTYDDLLNNEQQLFDKLVRHYDLQDTYIYAPKAKEVHKHYRKGDPNEWRTVYTADQRARVAQIVPRELLQHFGWQA